MDKKSFNSLDQKDRLQAYLCRSLDEQVRLISTEQFAASTRSAPWHLVVQTSIGLRDFVMRLDEDIDGHEINVLRAMVQIPEIPTPQVYGWEPDGRTFGIPCFLYDFIDGTSLLQPMLADEEWAVDLYLKTVIQLN
jgi:aminoglycoside phosphotransferase (APT) family kinase protein